MLTSSIDSFLLYLNHFELVDYGTYIWFIFLAFLFLILSIILFQKYTIMGFFIFLLSLLIFFIGPFAIKWYLDGTTRKNETTINLIKQLQFSNTLILQGSIHNLSKKDFSTCKINFGFFRNSKNKYKQFFSELFPAQKRFFMVTQPIVKNESVDFRVVLENFRLHEDVNISTKSECY